MKQLANAAVDRGKQHLFTMHGLKRRITSTLTNLGGYYIGMGLVDQTTTMEQFYETATMPYALIGAGMILLGSAATTGNSKAAK